MVKRIIFVIILVVAVAAGYYFNNKYSSGPVEELKVTSIEFGGNE